MKRKIIVKLFIMNSLLIIGIVLIAISYLLRYQENRAIQDKIYIVPNLQYINTYKDEKLYFNLKVIDTKNLFSDNHLDTYLISKNGQKDRTQIESINKIPTNIKKCNIYNIILSTKLYYKGKKQYHMWEVTKNNKTETLKIGKLYVNRMNFSERKNNKKLKIMATLKSIDGKHFSLFLKNLSTNSLYIKQINCGLNTKKLNLSAKKISIKLNRNEEKEIRLALNNKVQENLLVIRPIIKYSIKGETYYQLTSANIIFEKNDFTKQEVIDLLKKQNI